MRFPGFEGEWEEAALNELGDFLGGGTPASSNADFWNGNIPWISSSDLSENDIYTVNVTRFITEDAINNSATKFCTAPVILIVSRVGVGKVAYSGTSLCTSQDFINVANLKCNGIFLSYLLSIVMKKTSSNTQGTSIKGISSADVKSKKLFIPQKNEQQKIADFLSLIDQRIQAQNKILLHYQSLIQNLRNDIFKQKVRLKNDNQIGFPNWRITKLTSIAEKKITKNKKMQIKTVLSNSASFGIINQSDFFDKEIANQDKTSNYYIVENDDFVYNPRISREAPVGPISRNKIGTGIMSPLYMVFRFKEGNVVDFFEHFFHSDAWFTHMKNIANYGARSDRMSFSNSDFFEMPVPIPSIQEQKRIASFLSLINQKIQTEKAILTQLEMQKRYLLKNLFV